MSAIGIIFSNIHDHDIPELTKRRTLGSIPFGGRYRLIDFVLSNMVNSGITSVGVITRNNYHSLMSHLGSGKEWDLSRKFGGLIVFPPFSTPGGVGLYSGRIEALKNILEYLERAHEDYVIMADCDIVCNMDYARIIEFHESRNADITAVYQRKYHINSGNEDITTYGLDSSGRIYSARIGRDVFGEQNLSLNMWVLKRSLLVTLVSEAISVGQLSLERDIIAKRADTLRIFGYNFDGTALHIDSVKTLFDANMALLEPEIRKELFSKTSPIYTRVHDEAPVRYAEDAKVSNSLIANGSVILSSVENSIISRGVYIGRGAKVKNSIIMQGAVIGEDSDINYAIIDKHSVIKAGRILCGYATHPFVIEKNSIV